MEFPDTGWNALPHQITLTILERFGETAPVWLHLVLHTVLVWAPLFLILVAASGLWRALGRYRSRQRQVSEDSRTLSAFGLPKGLYSYVLRYSKREQAILVTVGLASMPILYATLELPKIIVNTALDAAHFPDVHLGYTLSQTQYLLAVCAIYLFAILANGSVKFWFNIRKGQAGERLLRRLRLTVYRSWRARADRNADAIPLIAQEVEPVGGFATEAFATPVYQGGTFVTILAFMFIQDPVLGAAALTMLPFQLFFIPRLQRRINVHARERVAEIRRLGTLLGDQAYRSGASGTAASVGTSFRRIETIRLKIHRIKFFMKGLNNFLTAMTPFFFYSLGGYRVIQGDLSLGALIAVLAAYKDFSAPLKELLRYYQSFEDSRIRYADIRLFSRQSTQSEPDDRTLRTDAFAENLRNAALRGSPA